MSASTAVAAKPHYTPTSLLDNDLARVYTHIHPLVVLSIYFLSFKLVVADPVSALLSLLLPLAGLQVVYIVLCLPPTGSHSVAGHGGKPGPVKGAGQGKKGGKGKAEVTLGMKVIVRVLYVLRSLDALTPRSGIKES
jgi:phosphatidylinositol glycan class F